MDTELARTFLTVVAVGNFVSAAERLHVSQSTVSTRIHTLEEYLGCILFVRDKAGATLTAAGRQFQGHASTLVRTVERARQESRLSKDCGGTLVVGGRIGLWEDFLLQWLPLIRASMPDVSIRAETSIETEIIQGLMEGRVDIGVLYTPQSYPGLKVEQLFYERLVFVSTTPKVNSGRNPNYIHIDWGAEFQARYSACFPSCTRPSLAANVGWLGLRHVLKNGGSGYFPLRIVRSHLEARRLNLIEGYPEFSIPAYAVYHSESEVDISHRALQLMHRVAADAMQMHGDGGEPVSRARA